MLPHHRLDGSDEFEAMTTIAKSPSIAPAPLPAPRTSRPAPRHVHASLEVSDSRNSVRPIVFDARADAGDADVTRLMPSPHAYAAPSFPAPPRVPNDIGQTMRPLKNRVHLPRGQGGTEPPPPRGDHGSMRPTAPPAPPSRPSAPPQSMRPQTPPSMRPPSMRPSVRPIPPPPISRPEDTFRPVAVANAMNPIHVTGPRANDSARWDAPPIAHNTATELVLKGRPTASWAMALVAMGVFAGILTAVVTGGGASSLVQAGAAFVDPSRAAAANIADAPRAAAAPAPVEAKVAPLALPAPYDAPASTIAPKVEATPTPATPEPVAVKTVAPVVAAKPAAPVAAAPIARPQPRPVAAPQPIAAAPKPVLQEVRRPKALPAAPTEPKTGKAGAADLASAAQADELARQQLEQSLK
jgi:hypothetical protein